MNGHDQLRAEIDNYSDTVFAIIGFMNFYRFDDARRVMRDDVIVFQGRKLSPSPAKAKTEKGAPIEYVTPDIGILLPTQHGVLGEVKKSFPMDEEAWMDDFLQLMSYDDDLTGWPSASEKVATHDVVLLLHQSRAVRVRKFYDKHNGQEIGFTRPFCIIEFNRSNEANAYFFFRVVTGALSAVELHNRLEEGVQVPMVRLASAYSTIKLCDHEPPLPYIMELIWTHVVTLRASDDPKFSHLHANQCIEIEIPLAEITDELYQRFTFRSLSNQESERQPKVPQHSLVQRACEKLVEAEDAMWIDKKKDKIMVRFTKRTDVLKYFIDLCAKDKEGASQMPLFKEGDGK